MQNTTSQSHISVIIPVYNEGTAVNDAIRNVWNVADGEPVEIIVTDGGPGHETLDAVSSPDVIRVKSAPGRGPQMNAGAAVATGDILLFLHADSRLPVGALRTVRRTLAGRAQAGAFSLAIDAPGTAYTCLAFFANLRSRLERIPYGDQAQFLPTPLFRELGGFADIPIMEDVNLFRRIRKSSLPIAIAHDAVKTSPRRWREEGILRRTLKNWWLRIRYRLGASPDQLVRGYRPPNSGAEPEAE